MKNSRYLPLLGTCAVVVAAMAFHHTPPAQGQADVTIGGLSNRIHVTLDHQRVRFPDQQPVSIDNRVLVPLRGVFQALGASVDWDPADQSIVARKGDRTVRLRSGSADASVNRRPVTLDVPAQMIGGRVMVPLRFVSEALGAQVRWMDATQTVSIETGSDMAALPAAAPATSPAPEAATAPEAGTAPDAQAIFLQKCGRCHHIGELGRGRISLAHEGAKHDRQWIEVQIRSPEQHASAMPAFPPERLSDRDLRVVSRYLAGLQ